MTPTPGRIVMYCHVRGSSIQEYPAVVLRVGMAEVTDLGTTREWVDLEVFGMDTQYPELRFARAHERVEYGEHGTWWWPPRVP